MKQIVELSTVVIVLFASTFFFSGCIITESYPKGWPKIDTSEDNKCLKISGVYKNNDTQEKTSLSGIFHDEWHILDKYKIKLSVSDGLLKISATLNVDYENKRELKFREDIFCEDNKIIYRKKGFEAEDVVMGYINTNYTFQIAEDGSLILSKTQSTVGTVCLIPIAGSEMKYYRFERLASESQEK